MSTLGPTEPLPVTPGWDFVSIGFENDPVDIGGGVNPWSRSGEWRSTGREITVAHPSYPQQRHSMHVYVLSGHDLDVTFAAGEFSNGVWAFFIPPRERALGG